MRLEPVRKRLKRWLAYALLERLQMMAVRFAPRKVVLLGKGAPGPNPFGPAFKFRRKITIINNGMPKRDHTIRIMLNASNFNFAHARSDGFDVQIALVDGITPLGHSPKARSGFYRPLWVPASNIGALSVTVPWIPTGKSFLYLEYGNPAATDTSDQTHTFQSPVPPTDLVLVNAGALGSQPYLQAQTHLLETLDNKVLQYFGAFGGNAGNDGQLWQWVSSDYQSNANWPANIVFTKLIQSTAGNSVSPYGNGCVRANGDILLVIGAGTNNQIGFNTEPIYVVKRDPVGGGISNYLLQNPLPNPQFPSSLQVNFGSMLEQANGDLWLFMSAARPTETTSIPPVVAGAQPNGGNWSVYILVCPNGADPTNGNNWGLLGGSFANATVVQGGNMILPGTVAATNGQPAIVGTGTTFTRQFYTNGGSILANIWIAGVEYAVSAVADDTHLTLTTNYTGVTAGGLAVGLGMSATEMGVDMDPNGNIAISFWNNSQGTGVGPVMQVYSLSRTLGIPNWTLPQFLTLPNGAFYTGNQTDMFIDPNGFLIHTHTRDNANMTIYTSCDWKTAGGNPTWAYPLRYNLAVPVEIGNGDQGLSTAAMFKRGINANLLMATMYYPPGGNITNTTGNAVSPIVVTAPNHALVTGQVVNITGVTGNTNANGNFTITFVDANNFSLNGTTGNGAYAGGGTWKVVGVTQRNIALITTDLLALVKTPLPSNTQFLENWDSGSFATNAWTLHTNCSMSNTQLLNGRTNSCLCSSTPVLNKTNVFPADVVQTAISQWFYITSGNPAFALSVGNERYAWFSGASPHPPNFYNGTGGTNTNTFPTAVTVANNGWHHAKLSIDSATAHDPNALTLQLTMDGVWLGQGVLLNAGAQRDLYPGDFVSLAGYFIGDIAVESWTDQEPTVLVGSEILGGGSFEEVFP